MLLFSVLGLPGTAVANTSSSKTEKSLQRISSEIQSLNEKDIKLEGQQGKLSRQLRESSRKLNKLVQRTRELQKIVDKQTAELSLLGEKIEQSVQRKKDQEVALVNNLRAQQKLQTQRSKTPLSGGNISGKQRQEFWLKHLNQQHQTLLTELNETVSNLNQQRAHQQSLLEKSRSDAVALERERHQVDQSRSKQKRLIGDIKKQQKKNKNDKARLKKDQARLKTLLEKLRFAEENPEFIQEGKVSFRKLKGKLPWPIKGKIQNKNFSSGVVLKASIGTKVRAITHGRIVFADWMKGFGMLIVIDHGEGYMSLYGQNESLFAKTGQWVEPGTVIGSTGQGQIDGQPGLYFELRKKTQALKPKDWCRKR